MSQPLTDQQLADIRERAAHVYEYRYTSDDAETLAGADVPALLAEVDRLRAELAENTGVLKALHRQRDEAEAERDQLRARRDAALAALKEN